MLGPSSFINALRVAPVWLLTTSVFFGPAGLGGSAALAAVLKTCGVSCPCEETNHDDHADDDHHADSKSDPCADEHATAFGHDDSDPCQQECPDDCPSCSCCLGPTMALLPLTPGPNATNFTSERMLALIDALPRGARSGVFRPPRALT